jgi:hypothetical protein
MDDEIAFEVMAWNLANRDPCLSPSGLIVTQIFVRRS